MRNSLEQRSNTASPVEWAEVGVKDENGNAGGGGRQGDYVFGERSKRELIGGSWILPT